MNEYSVFKLYSDELKREVRIYISLPKSYYKTDKHYPVLYMHDGQNLFDDLQAHYGKSWGILEAYETYPDLPELVIVGIESNDSRNNELVPFKFRFEGKNDFVGGKTDDYLDFIINTLKPVINNRYRTFVSPKNTGIMGSSFGGLCSTYAALKFSDHFTKFGCVSNAYFPVQKDMLELVKTADISKIKKMYMDVGTKESDNPEHVKAYIESNQEIYDALQGRLDKENIVFEIIDGAIHNESAWELRFPRIINFLFNQ